MMNSEIQAKKATEIGGVVYFSVSFLYEAIISSFGKEL